MPLHVNTIDWAAWQPTERANLCFVIREGKILLIRKKRGLGAGKINGPGGRLEPGETPEQSAIREAQEEVGITPTGLRQAGELHFQFLHGYGLHVYVFGATDCSGTLVETDEAAPFWVPIGQIPYEQMWQDDPHWVPLLLAGTYFRGFFIFEQEQLLSFRVLVPEPST